MKSRLNLFWLTIVIGSLSGCATMSGDECMTSDWSAIGYEDGSRGFATERFGQHRKACAKHGVTPDFSAYQHGRYNGVCSVNLEADFLDAYNAGYHLYSLRSNVNRANSSIRSKEKELEQIEDTLIKDGVEIIAEDTTQEQRIYILADMKRLAERTGQLQAEIKELHEVRARSQVELDHYQLVVADMGY